MTPLESPERRRAFCARLKSERERRGTSLRDIADTTKVKASLLEALERGDVSRWPKGIYRRAFFREYVAACGLPSDEYAAEFLELFPDGEEPPPASRTPAMRSPAAGVPAAPAAAAPPPSPLRLTLDQDAGGWRRWLRSAAEPPLRLSAAQPLAAMLDVALVVGVAYAIAATGVAGVERALAAVACVYYTVGTALIGRSPCSWALARGLRLAPRQAPAVDPPAHARAAGSASQRSRLRELAGQALRTRSALREYAARVSSVTVFSATSQRRRELNSLRRRRVETANRAVDEAI